jgi:hypothetical protein
MLSENLKRTLAVAVALASFLLSSPVAAAPVSLRSFAKENLQLATIAYRISTETAADCPDPQIVTGLLTHDLSNYDRSVRPAVSRAFSLGTGIGVLEVVPGSAAERAGLRTDDEILSVNGLSVQDPAAVDEPRRSSRRLEKFSKALQLALRNGPAELEIRRSGAVVGASLAGELGCGGELLLSGSRERNAWSDGSHVVVTTAMMRLARSDDELAFVIAHEMAHNILGHSSSSKRGIFGLKLGGKRQELAADYMAVWMMTEGGYKAEGGISFLRTVRRRLWWNISLDHPSFGRRIKTVSGAITSAANSPLWARAHLALAATANAGEQLSGTVTCGGPRSGPCNPFAGEAREMRAGGASLGADRLGRVNRVPEPIAPPALNRTGDGFSVDQAILDIADHPVSGTLAPQPGVGAPPTILKVAHAIAPDVEMLGIVQRAAVPEALHVVLIGAKVAADFNDAVRAPTASGQTVRAVAGNGQTGDAQLINARGDEQPDSICASLVPAPCAPRSALSGSRPHWHSGPNQPLCDLITLAHSVQCRRSGGGAGFGISEGISTRERLGSIAFRSSVRFRPQ